MNDFHQWWDAVWAQAVHDQQLLRVQSLFEPTKTGKLAGIALNPRCTRPSSRIRRTLSNSLAHRRRSPTMHHDQQNRRIIHERSTPAITQHVARIF